MPLISLAIQKIMPDQEASAFAGKASPGGPLHALHHAHQHLCRCELPQLLLLKGPLHLKGTDMLIGCATFCLGACISASMSCIGREHEALV